MLCDKQPHYLCDIKRIAFIKLRCLCVRWMLAVLDWAHLRESCLGLLWFTCLSFSSQDTGLGLVCSYGNGRSKRASSVAISICTSMGGEGRGVTLYPLVLYWSKQFTWINSKSRSREIFLYSLLQKLQIGGIVPLIQSAKKDIAYFHTIDKNRACRQNRVNSWNQRKQFISIYCLIGYTTV